MAPPPAILVPQRIEFLGNPVLNRETVEIGQRPVAGLWGRYDLLNAESLG
jgi:hypothetical protein